MKHLIVASPPPEMEVSRRTPLMAAAARRRLGLPSPADRAPTAQFFTRHAHTVPQRPASSHTMTAAKVIPPSSEASDAAARVSERIRRANSPQVVRRGQVVDCKRRSTPLLPYPPGRTHDVTQRRAYPRRLRR